MMYDDKCYGLAQSFLSDYPAHNTELNRDRLAQEIQQAIENFFAEKGIE